MSQTDNNFKPMDMFNMRDTRAPSSHKDRMRRRKLVKEFRSVSGLGDTGILNTKERDKHRTLLSTSQGQRFEQSLQNPRLADQTLEGEVFRQSVSQQARTVRGAWEEYTTGRRIPDIHVPELRASEEASFSEGIHRGFKNLLKKIGAGFVQTSDDLIISHGDIFNLVDAEDRQDWVEAAKRDKFPADHPNFPGQTLYQVYMTALNGKDDREKQIASNAIEHRRASRAAMVHARAKSDPHYFNHVMYMTDGSSFLLGRGVLPTFTKRGFNYATKTLTSGFNIQSAAIAGGYTQEYLAWAKEAAEKYKVEAEGAILPEIGNMIFGAAFDELKGQNLSGIDSLLHSYVRGVNELEKRKASLSPDEYNRERQKLRSIKSWYGLSQALTKMGANLGWVFDSGYSFITTGLQRAFGGDATIQDQLDIHNYAAAGLDVLISIPYFGAYKAAQGGTKFFQMMKSIEGVIEEGRAKNMSKSWVAAGIRQAMLNANPKANTTKVSKAATALAESGKSLKFTEDIIANLDDRRMRDALRYVLQTSSDSDSVGLANKQKLLNTFKWNQDTFQGTFRERQKKLLINARDARTEATEKLIRKREKLTEAQTELARAEKKLSQREAVRETQRDQAQGALDRVVGLTEQADEIETKLIEDISRIIGVRTTVGTSDITKSNLVDILITDLAEKHRATLLSQLAPILTPQALIDSPIIRELNESSLVAIANLYGLRGVLDTTGKKLRTVSEGITSKWAMPVIDDFAYAFAVELQKRQGISAHGRINWGEAFDFSKAKGTKTTKDMGKVSVRGELDKEAIRRFTGVFFDEVGIIRDTLHNHTAISNMIGRYGKALEKIGVDPRITNNLVKGSEELKAVVKQLEVEPVTDVAKLQKKVDDLSVDIVPTKAADPVKLRHTVDRLLREVRQEQANLEAAKKGVTTARTAVAQNKARIGVPEEKLLNFVEGWDDELKGIVLDSFHNMLTDFKQGDIDPDAFARMLNDFAGLDSLSAGLAIIARDDLSIVGSNTQRFFSSLVLGSLLNPTNNTGMPQVFRWLIDNGAGYESLLRITQDAFKESGQVFNLLKEYYSAYKQGGSGSTFAVFLAATKWLKNFWEVTLIDRAYRGIYLYGLKSPKGGVNSDLIVRTGWETKGKILGGSIAADTLTRMILNSTDNISPEEFIEEYAGERYLMLQQDILAYEGLKQMLKPSDEDAEN